MADDKKASELYKKLLDDNNLNIQLSPPTFEQVSDGSVLIKPPKIIVSFKNDRKPTESTSK